MNTVIKAGLAAFSLAGAATPAAAEQVSVAVYYGDLNLTDDRGMKTLENRVDGAIRQVCGRFDNRSIVAIYSIRECRRNLRKQAKLVLGEIGRGSVTVAKSFAIVDRG